MRPSVDVVVITFRRQPELRSALESLRVAARCARSEVDVGVVVVDDDPEGSAEAVAAEFGDGFHHGCRYVSSGAQNIARARNLGIESVSPDCDWVASIDDDVVVPSSWFTAGLAAVRESPFTALTGSLVKDFSAGPSWLRNQPFDRIGITEGADGQEFPMCATGNNWISGEFLRTHADLRFDTEFGVSGGEDFEFFSRAVERGLRPVFSRAVNVVEHQPAERRTFRYQLRRSYWLGVTEAKVQLHMRTASRGRLVARAVKRSLTAGRQGLDPEHRRRRRLRYVVAVLFQSSGTVMGVAGATLDHK